MCVGVRVGVRAGVLVGRGVATPVGISVGVWIGAPVGARVGTGVSVSVTVGAGASVVLPPVGTASITLPIVSPTAKASTTSPPSTKAQMGTRLRGRAHGWLRETLEGAMFLPAYGLLAPDAPETEWIMKDYEDNLYISEQYGYAIPAFERFWFSRGGFSMQANLLDGPLPYLWRDDIKHFVRAYFNSFASAFYPEVRMCNEHSLPELGYPRGDHFKSSDEAQSTYWLRLMFVSEAGSKLYLGQAIPRYWLSHGNKIGIRNAPSNFGVLSFTMESRSAEGRIQVLLDPPRRNPPESIFLRLRHPDGRTINNVNVNGQPYDHFDADREWIVLEGNLDRQQKIVARY